MSGPPQHKLLIACSVIITMLTCALGNSADYAVVSRLAEISAHEDVLATRDTSRSPLMRTDAEPNPEVLRESMLTRYLFPLPPSNRLYLSEPKKFTFSEDREDLLLQPLLQGIHKGFFVESGAFDGEKGSNTLYFERQRGWTGLLVEPSPLNVPKLRAKGRQAYVFSGCLSDTLEQSWLGDLLVSNGEHGHLTSEHDSTAHPVPVTCAPLPALLKLIGRSVVDLWSLNVEGSEVRVLQGMNFAKIEVGVLLVAAHHAHNIDAEPQIVEIMQMHGFREVGRRSSGADKPTHITFVNPRYFLKRGLPVPTGRIDRDASQRTMLMKSMVTEPRALPNSSAAAPNSTAAAPNSTTVVTGNPRLSQWASIPLILVISALSVACCLKADVKGPADC